MASEDGALPTENGDIPASYVSLPEGRFSLSFSHVLFWAELQN